MTETEKRKARAREMAQQIVDHEWATPEEVASFIDAALSAAYAEGESNITAVSKASYAAGREDEREALLDAQPSTAENPNEDTYQRGYFDGVMAYSKIIRARGASHD